MNTQDKIAITLRRLAVVLFLIAEWMLYHFVNWQAALAVFLFVWANNIEQKYRNER